MPTFNMGAEGRIVARRLDKHRHEIQRLEFKNAFLDVGMDRLIQFYCEGVGVNSASCLVNQMNTLFLGTGTTAPTVQDGGLESRSGTLSGKPCTAAGSPPTSFPRRANADSINHVYWTEADFVFQYAEGEAEGVWTELGLAGDANYTYPMTRALFRDDAGSPTSLTILSDEFLEVTYTVRFYAGIGAPLAGSFMVGSEAVGYTLFPIAGSSQNGWRATYTYAVNNYEYSRTGLWSYFFPFSRVTYMTQLYGYPSTGDRASADFDDYAAHSYTRTFDPVARKVTHSLVIDPTSSDVELAGLLANSSPDHGNSTWSGLFAIKFDAPMVKRADYRVALDIDVTFNIQLPPVTGATLDAATGTTLDFSWDAYPDASEYEVVLRQAGTVVGTQTITAPTATASFTGLTASTEYHVDVAATTSTGRESVNAILAGSTTA